MERVNKIRRRKEGGGGLQIEVFDIICTKWFTASWTSSLSSLQSCVYTVFTKCVHASGENMSSESLTTSATL